MINLKWLLSGALVGGLAAISWWWIGSGVDVERPALGADSADTLERHKGPDLDLARDAGARRSDAPAHSLTVAPDPEFGVVLVGRVVDEQGKAVPRADVALDGADARSERFTTTASGDWTQFETSPGRYELKTRASGFVTAVETLEVPNEATLSHTTVLRAARSIPLRLEDVDGNALDLGSSKDQVLEWIGVAVTREFPGEVLPARGVRRESGGPCAVVATRDAFSGGSLPSDLSDRYCGLVVLTEDPPLWAALMYRNAVLEARPIDGGESELVFVLDRTKLAAKNGTVRVRIVSRESGEAITDGVALSQPQGGTGFTPSVEDGALVFHDVAPGEFDLVSGGKRSNGLTTEYLERRVVVPPGAEIDLGTIVLGEPTPFDVHVVDEHGQPLAIPVIFVRPELVDGPDDMVLRQGLGPTPQSGIVTVPFLALGPTIIRAGGRDGRALVGVEVDTRVVNPVVLAVPPGIEVAFDWKSRAPDGSVVVVEDAAGVPLSSYLSRTLLLAPGRHTLVVLEGGVETRRVPFEVGASRTVVEVEEL